MTLELSSVREFLKTQNLWGLLLSKSQDQLARVSGFTGSMGSALILEDRAFLFVDGRYTLQAKTQVDLGLFTIYETPMVTPITWLLENGLPGKTIGFDPLYHKVREIESLKALSPKKGLQFIPLSQNPVLGEVSLKGSAVKAFFDHPLIFSGYSRNDKIAAIAKTLSPTEVLCLSAFESVAWLLNIRGYDGEYTPLPKAAALLYPTGQVDLFSPHGSVLPELAQALGSEVKLFPLETLGQALGKLSLQTVLFDPDQTPYFYYHALKGPSRQALDPCLRPRAIKNKVELSGARAAHIRDGVALTKFLYWVEIQFAAGEPLTEMVAAAHLDSLRAENELFHSLSFPTISAAGEHGAIIHYRPEMSTDRPLKKDEFYLVDSGAQYYDGTTDVTRTCVLGTVSAEAKRHYTQVLKGHIAVTTCVFPIGTTGGQLDALARQYVWAGGHDYAHGTGHGVGSFLGVHEGPQGITKVNTEPLCEGMILSNEPGFYQEDTYGIRLENLVKVVPGPFKGFLAFEPLTLAPFDLRAIDIDQLSLRERAWLKAYHERVFQTLSSFLTVEEKVWLERIVQAS